jgi:hypothetical protein
MIRPSMRTSGVRLGAGLIAGFLLWPVAPARALQGIGVSPTSQKISLAPGESQSGALTIINDGANDITYRLYATDFQVKGEDYRSDFSALGANPQVSATSWFKLIKNTAVIKARQQINVPYTVTAPANAAVGGHYAAVFVETVPPPNPGGTRIARIDRIGSLFYLAVEGALEQRGEVLALDLPWLQSTPPIDTALRVRNAGNVHFAVEGTLQLASPFGKVGKPVPVRGEILPGTTRRLARELASQSPIGLYKVTASVKYLDQAVERSGWVLLMPRLTFIIISSTVMLLLISGFVWLVRRRRS